MSSEPRKRGSAGEPEEARVLTDPKAMRALAHPVRVDLLQLFSVHETLTATQASELLGESPANCAFHLRTLAKYGFLKEAGGGRGRERPWTRVDGSLTITTRQEDPQAAVAADALSWVVFERWVERARQVLGMTALVPGWENAFGWSRSAVYLTAAETEELRTEMRQLLHRYESRRADPAQRPAGARPVEWALFAAPLTGLDVPGVPGITAGVPGDDSGEPAGQHGQSG
jgi:Helix-turn-helix domain